ncbi:hypothetical protein BBJ29_004045 [Phytophthora kernoviae]|uniref:Uncharacterized protein n=1 Tax=Phytophthora kernoviae TaxID=325452 RepID=A0A3F2RUJ9_9STRA|nr:hypothetical protein BBJ29_004045 [Phytophthora kernoviae]RLN64468.1 hypothetical protein BBP00_00003440 [Phytophthora kernoviae]
MVKEQAEISHRNMQRLLQSVGLVSDDTVVESFGEEHYFGQVMLDFKIKQIVRLYTATDRIVVAWRALISPEKFKGKSLSDILFEEKGALVIEPYTVCNGSKSIQELAEFVITGCRPGRAVDSMERTLHMQVTPPGLIATH